MGYALLAKAVSNDPELKQSLNSVKASYDEYIDNVQTMYTSHRAYMSMRNEIDEQLGVAEDNADDASTYLLDFSDMQAVRNSDDLQEAARVGSELETSLLSLLTVSYEYVKTQTLIRSQTLGNEVELVVDRVAGLLSDTVSAADGQDASGTLDEINTLVSDALNAITANDGVLQLQVDRLEFRNAAEKALNASDENIAQATVELE